MKRNPKPWKFPLFSLCLVALSFTGTLSSAESSGYSFKSDLVFKPKEKVALNQFTMEREGDTGTSLPKPELKKYCSGQFCDLMAYNKDAINSALEELKPDGRLNSLTFEFSRNLANSLNTSETTADTCKRDSMKDQCLNVEGAVLFKGTIERACQLDKIPVDPYLPYEKEKMARSLKLFLAGMISHCEKYRKQPQHEPQSPQPLGSSNSIR